jgi:hypothetical protein
MVWFYNSVSGAVIEETALGDTIQSHLPGWHGPFGTKQEALDYYASNASAHPDWKAPTGFTGNVTNTIKSGIEAATGVGGWVHNIEQWIVRAFEMALGLGLIILGLAKLASDTPAGKAAAKIATKAALL